MARTRRRGAAPAVEEVHHTTKRRGAQPAAQARESRPAAMRSVHPAYLDRRALTPAQVLSLQRTSGNHAVVRLLAGRASGSPGAVAGAIQRFPEGESGGPAAPAAAEDKGPITLPPAVREAVKIVLANDDTLRQTADWALEMSEFLAAQGKTLSATASHLFPQSKPELAEELARPELVEGLKLDGTEWRDTYWKLMRGVSGLLGQGPFPVAHVERFVTAVAQADPREQASRLFDLMHWINDLEALRGDIISYQARRTPLGALPSMSQKTMSLGQAFNRIADL